MSITLAQLRSSVRAHIDEPSANYWADVELNDYIGKRQLDLWKRIYQLRKDFWLSPTGFVLNLAVGKYQYQTADGIPADLFRITAIRTTQPGYQDIIWRSVDPSCEAFISGLRADVPIVYPYLIMYALRNLNTLWISPIPQQTLSAQVDYIQLPTEAVNDADTFLIPDPFLDYVEYMAASDALSKGPVGDATSWLQKAEESWKMVMLALDTPRSDQGPDTVEGMFENGGF